MGDIEEQAETNETEPVQQRESGDIGDRLSAIERKIGELFDKLAGSGTGPTTGTETQTESITISTEPVRSTPDNAPKKSHWTKRKIF